MALYLVRHAHAGSRKAWRGDDRERPLDERGERQAKGLLDEVPVGIDRVLSSPAVRCTETVRPLAERSGREIEVDERLFEAAEPGPIADHLRHLLGERPDAAIVACSHGDLIPDLLARWSRDGADLDDRRYAKGSVWCLESDAEGTIVSGRYRPPSE